MVALKRLLIVILVLLVPAVITGLLDYLAVALLHATNRVIDPDTFHWVSAAAYVLILLVAIGDARERW
ncbi:MAG TPA: hypothetical protein VMH86_07205 [Rhizomicrobium sp.]|nr:hypothetical protein [Rhizomicrobium sp.]